jgi:nicotinamidase-related amidase
MTSNFWCELPVPPFFDPQRVGSVWQVPYQERAIQARNWAEEHALHPASEDDPKIGLLLVDVQNTFCVPGFELYVGGRSGSGAVDDNQRLTRFIYRNLGSISHIIATFDTHHAMPIFHALFLVDAQGEHPQPYTLVSAEDVRQGRWRFNAAIAPGLGIDPEYGQRHLQHYVDQLEKQGKYALTIWPYHAMLGGIGHAMVSSVEEAIFFHTVARYSRPEFTIKGTNPLTEHYSAVGPEVVTDPDGKVIGQRNPRFFEFLRSVDALLIAGQAKSHCVAWTIEDLLEECQAADQCQVSKIYLLEDCTSPVVVPGSIDYTTEADAAFQRFVEAGAHLVRSTEPIKDWPGIFEASLAAR